MEVGGLVLGRPMRILWIGDRVEHDSGDQLTAGLGQGGRAIGNFLHGVIVKARGGRFRRDDRELDPILELDDPLFGVGSLALERKALPHRWTLDPLLDAPRAALSAPALPDP